MANYDFSTLNSTDLEELACDLLNQDQPNASLIKYKTFKDGKDKGIDFLYSTDKNSHEHIGQVKHYYRTGYDKMIYTLRNSEVSKVKKLDPTKYIFVTSVDLSVAHTKEIKTIFAPYIKNLNDVYGKKDLNRLIEEYSTTILKKHYKLWLSTLSILDKILNSSLEFRSSAFIENELKRRLRIYVKTSLFDDARDALAKNKFIIITGEPGVGKTTLAEMLVYEYIANGYLLTYILDDIKEAENALTPDNSKQIIYFDDFLGSNAVEINKAKGSETALRKILRRVDTMENKLIVFTTRTFLLNTALEESEQLRKFNIKAKSSLFELKEYNTILRKQLLANHIEDSELKEELKSLLNKHEIINFIVNHTSFSPRSVEFITSKEINGLTVEEFQKYIFTNFNSPSEIWKHAYSEQINEDDRLLLNTLLSFGQFAKIDELENAFLKRQELEIKMNNKSKVMHAFQKSISRLEGGFIILKNKIEVHFINPSLLDFLLYYLRKDRDEVMKIAESVAYASQLTARLFDFSSLNNIAMPLNLKKRLLMDYKSFIRAENTNYDLIQIALVIYKFIDKKEAEEVICAIIDEISDWEALHSNYSLNIHFREFMISVKGNHRIYSVLEKRILEIITELFTGESEISEAIELLEKLINDYDLDLSFLDTSIINSHLDDLFEDYISQECDWLKDTITDESEAYEKQKEISDLVKRINGVGIDYEPNLKEFEIDWYMVAAENEFKRQMEKDD